jgi:hypothetical protein
MCKSIVYILAALTLATVVGPLMSCKNTHLTTGEKVEIYAAVIRQLATVDDTFGGNLHPQLLYIIKNTDDTAADPSEEQKNNSVLIPQNMQENINGALNDLEIEIVWIDQFEDAKFDVNTGSVKNNGAIITLGNIYPQKDGTVNVAGSIYIGNLAAGGTTYVLSRINGVWTITSRTGPTWIS